MTSPITDERLKEILDGPTPDNEGWLIRTSGYFYRPDRAGYTANKAEAGRYSEEEATATHRSDPRRISAMPASEVPDSPPVIDPEKRAMASELLAAREALSATLPCDVHLPPATIIRAGCPVSTLLAGINARRARALSGNRSGN